MVASLSPDVVKRFPPEQVQFVVDAFRAAATSDPGVSHLFVSKRDRLGRPDNPLDSMLIEYQLRSAGLAIVLMGGKVLRPSARASGSTWPTCSPA